MAGRKHIAIVVFVFLTTGAAVVGRSTFPGNTPVEPAVQASGGLVAEGQRIFRFDTFGDEQLWTDTLHMQVGHWLEVRVPRQPLRERHHSAARCAVGSFGRTGISRAARPKRKMAAANSPIDSPHSMSVGE